MSSVAARVRINRESAEDPEVVLVCLRKPRMHRLMTCEDLAGKISRHAYGAAVKMANMITEERTQVLYAPLIFLCIQGVARRRLDQLLRRKLLLIEHVLVLHL